MSIVRRRKLGGECSQEKLVDQMRATMKENLRLRQENIELRQRIMVNTIQIESLTLLKVEKEQIFTERIASLEREIAKLAKQSSLQFTDTQPSAISINNHTFHQTHSLQFQSTLQIPKKKMKLPEQECSLTTRKQQILAKYKDVIKYEGEDSSDDPEWEIGARKESTCMC